MVLKEGKQLEQGEEHAGRDTDGDHRGNPAGRGLVDVETPAIGRERLEFDDQAGQQQQKRRRADRAGYQRPVLDHPVDIEGAGDIIEQHRAEQEERRSQHRGHDVLEGGGQRRGRPVEAEQAVGGDRDDLEEDELIEQVAGHHHAVDAHDQDKIKQQRGIASAQAGPELPCAEQRSDIDAEGEEPFPRTETKIDRERRHAAGGEDLDGRAAIVEPPQAETGNRGDSTKRHEERQGRQWSSPMR